jgi:hypothetical protein
VAFLSFALTGKTVRLLGDPMQFKAIEIEDYGVLKPFFENQPYRHSNYSLFSIMVWSDQAFRTSYALKDGSVLFLNEPALNSTDRHLFLPVSPARKPGPAQLRALATEAGVPQYWFVPDEYMRYHDRGEIEAQFTIMEQPEYEDYIYLTEDLARLRGNRFAGKRNQIRQFVRAYVETNRAVVEKMTADHAGDCLRFLEKWCKIRDCDADVNYDLDCERKAAILALQNVHRLDVEGIVIRVDGVVSAFAIASRLRDDIGVLNFEKAFPDIRGLYQFLDRECARGILSGYHYTNKESDMGISNLAQMKKAYRPVTKEKCYRLQLR